MPTTRRAKDTNKPKSVQLFRVLKELNVAADRIVETLKERGFELDAKLEAGNVNAKLTPEMYATLVETFSDDAEAKARVEDLRSQLAESRGEPVPLVEEAEEAQEPEPEEEPETEKEETAPVAEVEEPPEVEAETPEAREEEITAEVAAEESAEGEPEAVEEELQEEPEPAPVAEVEEPEETPEAELEEEEAPEPEFEEPEEEEPLDEVDLSVIRGDRYSLTGTKVLGKVDLSGIDSGRKRKRKRKKEKHVDTSDLESFDDDGPKRKKGGKRSSKKKVSEKEVQANLQETLSQMGGGSGRVRQKRRRARRDERAAEREAELQRQEEMAGTLRVMEFISTGELAEAMNVPVAELIQKGFGLGMMVSINQRLDADSIVLMADEFGFDVEFITDSEEELELIEEDAEEDLRPRHPVVTIMGHVDHGKTSLLDHIRVANVVAGEAGGITQHIGAYVVTLEDDRQITFLDTPGHEAFTAMRARGAQVTDLVIIVVAADDQVMPQTIEAINHARAAEVPMVIAINKMDRNEANPDKIMQQLSEQGVLVEQYGGSIQCEFISAKTGDGVPDLLEKVLIESELLELTANPDRNAVGTVIEARLDKGRGVVATVLVQTGTLHIGDIFVAGTQSGRVRAMFDERDNKLEEAGPSNPAAILGFSGSPEVGDRLVVMPDDREARDIAAKRSQLQREQTMHQRRHVSLDDLSRRMALGELTNLNLVVKGDVGGSVEALSDALLKITNDEVAVNIVHSGVGAINESDVMLAAASDAIIIGFQVRPVAGVRTIAEREEIDIRTYSVIYDAIEEVRDALEGLLSPEKTEQVNGTIEVRDLFRAPKVGTIAGSYVVEGKINRNDRVRLIRDGVVIYEGEIASLKRFKDDAREVAAGFECGLSIQGYNDIKVGDQIEAYEIIETKRTLTV
ncbi:MAG: translation initiation factor IF-2 [Rubricoccaceae bacterium]|nr:translation initiation factor IF-2 [Rubricoccaceae bacterium]